MARVNIVADQVGGKWVLRSIPKKTSGHYDWSVLAEGTYFIEWRESGQRKREPAGITAAQALEAQRKRRHELEGRRWNPVLRPGSSGRRRCEPAPPSAHRPLPWTHRNSEEAEHVPEIRNASCSGLENIFRAAN